MSLRPLHRIFLFISAFVLVFSFAHGHASAATGTILPAFQQSAFLNADIDNDSEKDVINWIPTNPGATPVTVSDSGLAGDIWGQSVGWIKLKCTANCGAGAGNNWGVTNDANGNLGGYAWGQNTGWISFKCTNNCGSSGNFGVTIDPATGEFDGHAWSQNYGYIQFSCPGADTGADVDSFPDTCVKTDWTPTTGGNPGGGSSGGGSSGPNNPNNQPAAYCSINAFPPATNPGGSSALVWSTNLNAVTAATIVSSATGNVAYPNAANGSVIVAPGQTTTYTASFAGTGATGTAACSTTVIIDPNIIVPPVTTPPTTPTTPTTPTVPTTPTIPTAPTQPTNPSTPGSSGTVTPLVPSAGEEFGCNGETCTTSQPLFTLPTGTAVRNAAQAVAVVALVAAAIANVPGLIFRLQNLLFAFLGFKKRRRNWGVIYDSVTKQPLDPAYVVLSDLQGNEVASSITDLDGRYGFLVAPGIYRMSAGKTHYSFPSALLAGRQKDELYDNLYFGGEIEIKRDGEVITRNVPMDPTETDWNEVAKREQKRFGFFKKADIVFHKIVNALFWIGFALAIFSVALVPVTFNFIALGLYVLLLILNMTGFGGRKYGSVRDANGKPLAFGIIRIFNAELHREIAHKVINANGKYYAIVPKGRYYLTIEQKNMDGTYAKVFTSPTMDVKNGIIKKDFKVY